MKMMINLMLVFAITFFTYQLSALDNFPAIPTDQEEEMMEEEEMMQEEEQMMEEEPAGEEMMQEEEQMMEEEPAGEEMMQEEGNFMEDAPPRSDENMKYYKDKYELTITDYFFEDVYNAVKMSIKQKACGILKETRTADEQGNYKGIIVSDFCVFAMGSDTTMENLKKYSVKVPIIRGGTFITGRFQYKFVIQENEDSSVHLRLLGEVSGFESYVTESVHFWDSNGYKETMMLRRVQDNLQNIAER